MEHKHYAYIIPYPEDKKRIVHRCCANFSVIYPCWKSTKLKSISGIVLWKAILAESIHRRVVQRSSYRLPVAKNVTVRIGNWYNI